MQILGRLLIYFGCILLVVSLALGSILAPEQTQRVFFGVVILLGVFCMLAGGVVTFRAYQARALDLTGGFPIEPIKHHEVRDAEAPTPGSPPPAV